MTQVARLTVRGLRPEEALEALERGMEGGPPAVRTVEVTAVFQTDYFISGIAPFGEWGPRLLQLPLRGSALLLKYA